MGETTRVMSASKIADEVNNILRPGNTIDEGFVKLLCDQGKVEHSVVPAYDGRKKDVYMIPETAVEDIFIMLAGEPKKEEKKVAKELTNKEVADILGFDVSTVNNMAREGVLPFKSGSGKNRFGYERIFNEDDVLEYMSKREKELASKGITEAGPNDIPCSEVAKKYSIDEKKLKYACSSGKIKSKKIKSGRRYGFVYALDKDYVNELESIGYFSQLQSSTTAKNLGKRIKETLEADTTKIENAEEPIVAQPIVETVAPVAPVAPVTPEVDYARIESMINAKFDNGFSIFNQNMIAMRDLLVESIKDIRYEAYRQGFEDGFRMEKLYGGAE